MWMDNIVKMSEEFFQARPVNKEDISVNSG